MISPFTAVVAAITLTASDERENRYYCHMTSNAKTRRIRAAAALIVIALPAIVLAGARSAIFDAHTTVVWSQQTKDPAAWGSDHVGKTPPDYVRGDECLFCHRNDIGPTWQKNAHGLTVRPRDEAPALAQLLKSRPPLAGVATQVNFFMGSRHRIRFLKKEGYGKFAILSTQMAITEQGRFEELIDADHQTWDVERFASRCAGCHTTAVDPKTRAFSAYGLDCFTCHGSVDLAHSGDTSLVWLSKKKRSDKLAITSICAQCHLRDGKSISTGLPYPNSFVPGDNLFRDFKVDFSRADDAGLNLGDRHIWRNVRDVVVNGNDNLTCLSCHSLHGDSSIKHKRILRAAFCTECHNAEGPLKAVKPYIVKSPLCEY